MSSLVRRLLFVSCAAAAALLLPSCATTNDPMVQAQIEARRMAITSEPRGDWYIGRRYYIPRTQFWGYLRRPGQSWDEAKLAIFNEFSHLQPDRVYEEPADGSPAHGYDHNYEYRIYGNFTGDTVYDPNSDIFLPEFRLTGHQLISANPGWLFNPKEKYDGRRLLRNEPGLW